MIHYKIKKFGQVTHVYRDDQLILVSGLTVKATHKLLELYTKDLIDNNIAVRGQLEFEEI